MKESYYTIYEGGTSEISIKKSRFIATVSPVRTEEEAIAFIDTIKKKHWDAAHNCSAYIIGIDQPLMRCSDDGEPSKTAGWPMLDVLMGQELTNLVVVVTRYFGGTLLGTGGLVKAYQTATKEGLNHSLIIKKELGKHIRIIADYHYIGKVQYLINQESFPLLSSEYTELVRLHVLVPPSKYQALQEKLIEATNNTITIEEMEQVYFATIANEIHLFH